MNSFCSVAQWMSSIYTEFSADGEKKKLFKMLFKLFFLSLKSVLTQISGVGIMPQFQPAECKSLSIKLQSRSVIISSLNPDGSNKILFNCQE